MIHDAMPYDPIQGEGYRGPKCAKWPIFNAVSSASMHVVKRLMVDYDTPRQYLNFNWTDF